VFSPSKNQKSKIKNLNLLLTLSIWVLITISATGWATPATGEEALELGEMLFRSRDLEKAREAFEKLLLIDSQNAFAHYLLGLVEYEEGNIEKAKMRFQIAHECINKSISPLVNESIDQWANRLIDLPDAKHVQLEFSDNYDARVYYKDGWYVRPKGKSMSPLVYGSMGRESVNLLTLDGGSTYRIELKSGHKESWVRVGVIGVMVALSFFLAR